MEKRNPSKPVKRLVWRISEHAPMGEWIDPNARRPAPSAAETSELFSNSWVTSSFDLLKGIQVIENPATEPGELFIEVLTPTPDTPKRSDV